jgi:glycosyltransferase involved in cell wall biosynthesis
MLSILITVYNYNLYPLVQELHKQCLECNIEFEILTQDDASGSILNNENQKINSLSNCYFGILEKNVGYRENRNLMAAKAKFDYLLFIDGDCNILNNNYIKKFIDNIKDFDAVYGGRLHNEKCPSDNQKLRWKYGRFVEDKSAENRKKTPYQSLLFNNTIIKKEWFEKIKFDNSFRNYGHDDTQFSYKLMLLNAKINHIENPTEHNDIDFNEVYLTKMQGSLNNLYLLYKEKKIANNYGKLVSLIHFLKITKLSFLVSIIYKIFKELIFKNLKGKNPNLKIYNAFRIGHLCSIKD